MDLQDKVGPFARSAADAAVVLYIIRGADPTDPFHCDQPLATSLALQHHRQALQALDFHAV